MSYCASPTVVDLVEKGFDAERNNNPEFARIHEILLNGVKMPKRTHTKKETLLIGREIGKRTLAALACLADSLGHMQGQTPVTLFETENEATTRAKNMIAQHVGIPVSADWFDPLILDLKNSIKQQGNQLTKAWGTLKVVNDTTLELTPADYESRRTPRKVPPRPPSERAKVIKGGINPSDLDDLT